MCRLAFVTVTVASKVRDLVMRKRTDYCPDLFMVRDHAKYA